MIPGGSDRIGAAKNLLRNLTIVMIVLLPVTILAAADESASKNVAVSLDSDTLMLLRATIWIGGIFLALFAFIGLAFFGWDVRKARASLTDAQKETRELLKQLQADFADMKVLKEKLEQLGAQLEESGISEAKEPPLKQTPERTAVDLIREVIRTSNYEWTTVGRIVKQTGLNREQVLEEVRKAPDIRISTGRKTQDFIFKFKSDASAQISSC